MHCQQDVHAGVRVPLHNFRELLGLPRAALQRRVVGDEIRVFLAYADEALADLHDLFEEDPGVIYRQRAGGVDSRTVRSSLSNQG